MKFILFFILFISLSLVSYSQKNNSDTINIFQNNKKERKKKDAVQEIQSQPQSKQGLIKYIKYGTSAGMCIGYCFHEATIDSNQTVTVNKPMQTEKNYPVKTDSVPTTNTQWDMLISSVEINSFFSIPKKVGNPGVGDAVSEWIEIKYINRIHKVTFDSSGPEEYEGIKNLEKLLKKITGF